jgi:EAL domain-containing protein (putative c-di-GMP-specific phosphodiesterase class I)
LNSPIPSTLEAVLETGPVRTLFQPVFDLSMGPSAVHFLECLTRGPGGTNLEPAPILFEYARRKCLEHRLDRLCVKTALASAPALPGSVGLSMNVHGSTLERDPDFAAFIVSESTDRGFAPCRLIIEIVEHAPAWDGPRFRRALDSLSAAGVRIALDDIGLGQSNYRMILETRPHYFKLDRFLVEGCSRDSDRRAVLESIVRLAAAFDSRVVAEGPGSLEDIETVRQIGVDLIQGFLLSRPLEALGASRLMEGR